ncbi:MAG: formate dehydrogenase accessory sulfurtransferase FdhD [Crocinitomicaceae bacterium]|nr:formate dehydrogenase accessory sulfurtransferase FdhD [Crocinitomicaceae bacterium]
MSVHNYQGKRYQKGKSELRFDALTMEEPLQIDVNGKPFTLTMRTPGDDRALVRGLLHSEGVIKSPEFNPELIFVNENKEGILTQIALEIPTKELGDGYSNSRNLLSVASCGICGKTSLEEIGFMDACLDSKEKFDLELLEPAFLQMQNVQDAFRKSGGSHAAAAFDWDGVLLCYAEDIGRHNAVDKIIGKLILEEKYKKAALLTVSGRISYEIVVKSFKGRVPILAAVSAPSSLAVDYAKELGLTLFAFCRGDRATCYAHPERINENRSLNNQVS